MKKIVFIFCCMASTVAVGQSIRVTSDAGYSITKLTKEKRIVFFRGLGLGFEKYLSNNWYLELLPNTYTIEFSGKNNTGENTFTTIGFLGLNLEAKKYLPITAKTRIYLALGLHGSNLYRYNVENNTLSTETTRHNLGYNFGFSSSVGLRVTLTRIISFDIGIGDQEDYLFSYSNPIDEVDNSKRSLKVSFYLQLKK